MKHPRTVDDVMTHAVVSARLDAPVKEIVRSMRRWGVSAVPVLSAEGRVVGVVSDADVLGKVPGEDRDDAGSVTAGSLMSAPPVTVPRGATIAGAARLMARGHLKRLPVVDEDGRPVGVVSRSDLLKIYLRSDAELAEDVRHELLTHLIPEGDASLTVRVEDGAVKLAGRLPESVPAALALRLTRSVPGVVAATAEFTTA
ncbi:CBS domain-containing protein [Streptomyces venezuelae]|uniref:CBS domain-containing protein n=1 Tax=Streptomyces gardneri TaxID=66892 RepID=UPI0006BE0CB0|nr:CBS domain-containing protein [Streptomyces gardneri]ALO12492.1 CBS domain-containing protein [Streptomyces venezuelae]QPK49256.1 CBS domain-containing protein [Streptomyces gardneri]WRK40771.1 CBS domain-containing protein [Streptomyces venezuelae]CUM36880.1 Inosine-5'-monophosphate dehydrogenase [Streptomyces venezuelae]